MLVCSKDALTSRSAVKLSAAGGVVEPEIALVLEATFKTNVSTPRTKSRVQDHDWARYTQRVFMIMRLQTLWSWSWSWSYLSLSGYTLVLVSVVGLDCSTGRKAQVHRYTGIVRCWFQKERGPNSPLVTRLGCCWSIGHLHCLKVSPVYRCAQSIYRILHTGWKADVWVCNVETKSAFTLW